MKLFPIAFIPIMFSHWFGWLVSLCYITLIVVLLLMDKLYRADIFFNKLFLGILLFSSFFIVFNLPIVGSDISKNLIYSNIHLYLSLFFIVAIVLLLKPLKEVEIQKIARVIFWISFYTIVIEFVLVNALNVSKDIMPAVRFSPSYFGDYKGWHRPFGLTGQPSVNGGVLLIAFLLLVELNINNVKNVLGLVLGAMLTMSGQAILSVVLILGLIQLSRTDGLLGKLVLTICFLMGLFFLMFSNVFDKISFEYLIYVLWEKAFFLEVINSLNTWQIFFGTLGLYSDGYSGGNELYLLESIRLYGFIFTLIFWIFVWFLVKNSRNGIIVFSACLLASLHYPAIIYIEAQLPLALIYLNTLRNSRKNKPNSIPVSRDECAI